MYDGNPGEIDFGLSYRGFELSGVDCNTYINTLLRKQSSQKTNNSQAKLELRQSLITNCKYNYNHSHFYRYKIKMKQKTRAVCTELCRRVLCAPILIHEFFSYPEPSYSENHSV